MLIPMHKMNLVHHSRQLHVNIEKLWRVNFISFIFMQILLEVGRDILDSVKELNIKEYIPWPEEHEYESCELFRLACLISDPCIHFCSLNRDIDMNDILLVPWTLNVSGHVYMK